MITTNDALAYLFIGLIIVISSIFVYGDDLISSVKVHSSGRLFAVTLLCMLAAVLAWPLVFIIAAFPDER